MQLCESTLFYPLVLQEQAGARLGEGELQPIGQLTAKVFRSLTVILIIDTISGRRGESREADLVG